ncbi:hypothetical protein [Streptomyces virginiae]|uniref:Uncharacterized protein n=1 Tax=Streptomyces virginiae TaxID=1961 RepID=A0ABZ1TL98_STRVG|nr:hypothetical protein [Streptomyces virginiae]
MRRESRSGDAPADDAFLGRAARHRKYADDPRYRPDVITDDHDA